MSAATKVRPCEDPRFCLVLVDSQLNPGTKAWKLMRVTDKPKAMTQKGAA